MLIKKAPDILMSFRLLDEKRLNMGERFLLSFIQEATEEDGYCYKGNDYFSLVLNVSIKTVKNNLTKIRKCGFIEKTKYISGKRVIKLTAEALKFWEVEEENSSE